MIAAIILLVGLVGGKLASKARLPSVTGYIIVGLLMGPSFANVITKEMVYSLQFVNHLALGMLAIAIGAELHRKVFKKNGRILFLVSLGDNLGTFIMVALITFILGLPLAFSLVLGVLSMTVSPSGVLSIIKEYRGKGPFVRSIMTLVAIENLNCIIVFGITTAILQGVTSSDLQGGALILNMLIELGLALMIGILSGGFLAFLIWRKTNENKFMVMVIGFIFLNSGIGEIYGLSAILINMTTGALVTNLVEENNILSNALEKIELPIFVFFLTLAGAKLDLAILPKIGLVGVGYIVGRLGGKLAGSYISAKLTNIGKRYRRNLGIALTPQAGIVIGLSIEAEQRLPQFNGLITGIVLSGVVFFEIVGPILLKQALKNTGEID
nr:cation:proton antiporter [Alkaliphilus hydrothermalis]